MYEMERANSHHPKWERKICVRLITAHVEHTPQPKMILKCFNQECV